MISLLIVLVLAALFLWAISQLPLDPTLMRVIRMIVIVAICLYALMFLLAMFGVSSGIPTMRLH